MGEGEKHKSEYKNNERFTLPEKDFAVERLDTVKTTVREYKEDHPEVLSLCMFGSMVNRGNGVKETSDIDGWLYVDADEIPHEPSESPDEEKSWRGEISKKYSLDLRAKLKEKLGLGDEYVEHIRTFPIDEKVIDEQLAVFEQNLISGEDFEIALSDWNARNRELSGRKSSPSLSLDDRIEQLKKHQSERPKKPKGSTPDFVLPGMFHLEVGGGIKKYRKMLLEKLQEKKEQGERIFKEIIKITDMMEYGHEVGTGLYPKNVQEAVEMYG